MGTEVLRPQDFWADRFRPLPPPSIRRRSSRPHGKPSLPRLERPEQRRKSPSPSTSPLPNEHRRKSPSTSPLPSPNEYRRKSPSPSPLPSPPPPFPSPREQRRKSPSPSTSPLTSPPPPFLSPRDQRRKSPSPSTSPSPPRPLPPSSPSPSPSTSSQPPREFIPFQFPRRSFSVDELQTHYNRFGAPTPQMGRARIMMRRRQSLDTLDVTRMKRDFNTMARGGLINKKYTDEDEDDVYAGSAFFVSPSPSSLPLPSFFNNNSSTNKTTTTTAMKDGQFHDSATRDLRRLLRLE